ncbi:hypothetical protein GCM10009765_77040 [Fodinicola feengrottensis]|uniref:Uncharacterized protein n=1 Tax=Fodinicola feengrottensis TaxID=435914 RepID=A0ABN2J396_9ACTN
MTPEPGKLEQENQIVLGVVQALLGLITPAIGAISVKFDNDVVTLYFAVSAHSPELEADVDDISFELDAQFTDHFPRIQSQIFLGEPGQDWPGRSHRLVYLTKIE